MARNKKLRRLNPPTETPAANPVAVVPAAKVPVVPPPVVPPAPPPVVPVAPVEKPKKTRYVREQKQEKPAAKPAPLPPRSRTMTGRLMTKQLKLPPKDAAG